MIRFDALLMALLIVLTVASALGVVSSQHKGRKLHSEIEHQQTLTQNLELEWGRLQAKQSSLAAHRQVESIARGRLGMVSPDAEQIIVLEGGKL